jgi:hypothetical protein
LRFKKMERRGVFVLFLPLICSENALVTSVAVVASPNLGQEVIVPTEKTYNPLKFKDTEAR